MEGKMGCRKHWNISESNLGTPMFMQFTFFFLQMDTILVSDVGPCVTCVTHVNIQVCKLPRKPGFCGFSFPLHIIVNPHTSGILVLYSQSLCLHFQVITSRVSRARGDLQTTPRTLKEGMGDDMRLAMTSH